MERAIMLSLEKAKEFYAKGGEFRDLALGAYTEEELTKKELPKTWEEFCKNYPVQKGESWISGKDTIFVCTAPYDGIDRDYKNWTPSKKSAEAHLAMIQLEQLRNCWWNGWEPEWKSSAKCSIKNSGDGLSVIISHNIAAFLTFPTREMAEEFLKCFRDLIEKAGDLI